MICHPSPMLSPLFPSHTYKPTSNPSLQKLFFPVDLVWACSNKNISTYYRSTVHNNFSRFPNIISTFKQYLGVCVCICVCTCMCVHVCVLNPPISEDEIKRGPFLKHFKQLSQNCNNFIIFQRDSFETVDTHFYVQVLIFLFSFPC